MRFQLLLPDWAYALNFGDWADLAATEHRFERIIFAATENRFERIIPASSLGLKESIMTGALTGAFLTPTADADRKARWR